MNKLSKNQLLHFCMIFVVSAVAGLLYNKYAAGGQLSALAVSGYALAGASGATLVLLLVDRITRRR